MHQAQFLSGLTCRVRRISTAALARFLQFHGLRVPTEQMQQDGYMGAARYRGLEGYMHGKGWLQISTKQVRDWLQDSGNFPESYSRHQLSLEDCEIDHILQQHLGGANHPFNYYILFKGINRLWNGWWSLNKRTYMGRASYTKFKQFIDWHTAQVASCQIRLYDLPQ